MTGQSISILIIAS